MSWLRAAHCVIICVWRAVDNSKISPEQRKVVFDRSRSILRQFENVLRAQTWSTIEPERVEKTEGRQNRWLNILPHRLSRLLVDWTIDPLKAVYENRHGHEGVPDSLATTLQETWSAVEHTCPFPLDIPTIERIPMLTSITSISRALSSLRDLATQLQGQSTVSASNATPFFPTPDIQ